MVGGFDRPQILYSLGIPFFMLSAFKLAWAEDHPTAVKRLVVDRFPDRI
ncbi:MAG: hypothetical protein AAF607_15325 [Pseudomonadota bacterium]